MANPAPAPNNWRILIDLNVLLDVLMRREPFFSNAACILALVENGQIDGYVAGHSFATLFYLYRRQDNNARAYLAVEQILQVFSVAGINRSVVEAAARLGWNDFEDAIQACAAGEAGCDYVVTRNPRDYQDHPVKAIQPSEFLAVWAANLA